jgi:hypothetical protein
MDAITGVCLACQVTITLPMPDAWLTPAGEITAAVGLPYEAEGMRAWLHGLPCPRCGQPQIRITLPSEH